MVSRHRFMFPILAFKAMFGFTIQITFEYECCFKNIYPHCYISPALSRENRPLSYRRASCTNTCRGDTASPCKLASSGSYHLPVPEHIQGWTFPQKGIFLQETIWGDHESAYICHYGQRNEMLQPAIISFCCCIHHGQVPLPMAYTFPAATLGTSLTCLQVWILFPVTISPVLLWKV